VTLRIAGKPAWLVLGLVLLGLLATGSAGAERSTTAPTVTIDSTKFSGTWHEGWFAVWQVRVIHHLGRSDLKWTRVKSGSLNVVGTVSGAAQLQVTLRTQAGKVVVASKPFSAPAGRYSARLKLGRPLPGAYTVSTSVLGSSAVTLRKVEEPVSFPPPPEGVVAKASIAATRNGPSIKILHSRHEAWARFHFLTLPPGTRTVLIEWRRPDWVHVCQEAKGPTPNCKLPKQISADGSVYTFLRSPVTPLARGKWYCQMSVGSRVARRTFVTLR